MAALAAASVGVALVGLLGVLEVGVRLAGLGVELYDNTDPVLGHRFKPNLDTHAWEMGTRIHYRTNSLGFRGPEPAATKAGKRVVFVGDSFTAGSDWHEPETFPRLVEKALGVEVVNLGVPAFDTGTQLVALREIGLGLQPDAVALVIYTGNDIRENSREMSHLPRPTFSVDDKGNLVAHPFTPRGERLGQFILGRSAFYAWQKDLVRRLMFRVRARVQGGDPMHAVYSTVTTPAWDNAWRVTEALLRDMKRLTDARNIPLVVFVMPDVLQVDEALFAQVEAASPSLRPLQRDLPQVKLRAIAERLGLTLVDLLPALSVAGRPLDAADPLYNGHLVRRGHTVVSEVMTQELRRVLGPSTSSATFRATAPAAPEEQP